MKKRTDESGLEELRAISNMLDCCTESSLYPYTLEELIQLARAWRQSEWDIPIHQWTKRQRTEALIGIPPQWADEDTPVYPPKAPPSRWRASNHPSNLPKVPARKAGGPPPPRGFGS